LFKEETGENPVRARRRKTHITLFFYSWPQQEDTPLDKSEKAKGNSVEVGIFFEQNTFFKMVAVANPKGKIKYYLGECEL